MDPVLIGSVTTVLVSMVSATVQIARQRSARKIELARITADGLTARVRCASSSASLEEYSGKHHVRLTHASLRAEDRCGGHHSKH